MRSEVNRKLVPLALWICLTSGNLVQAQTPQASSEEASKPKLSQQPDNTKKNTRDQKPESVTPVEQSNNKADIEATARLRQLVVKQKGLSVDAQNVKIITKDGEMWLRGPVKTTEEKQLIERLAKKAAGKRTVKSEIEVEVSR